MDTMIKEINNSLVMILDDLEKRKSASAGALKEVEKKISEKIDEARQYKVEVDSTKAKIKSLEEEIATLEIDLSDLNDRFGKKDLNAIVEAGNREINSKIMDKQNQITKHRHKITELTEKARSIKDLLINLRKDKTLKEEKLNILTCSFEYYNKALNKVIEYATDNPNTLDSYETYPQTYQSYEYSSEPLVESKVFDEIASMDEEDSEDDNQKSLSISDTTFEDENEEEEELDNIYQKLKSKASNFEEISDSIDKEYEDIFGSKVEETVSEEAKQEEILENPITEITEEELNTSINVFEEPTPLQVDASLKEEVQPEEVKEEPKEEPAIPDIFGNEAPVATETSIDATEITKFLTENGLDYNKFSTKDQEYLRNIFNAEQFKKVLDVLSQNHINIENIYEAATILGEVVPEELGKLIAQLLLANQTTENIGYALSKINLVNNQDLSETIKSYGADIKDVNIVDLLIQAKNASGTNAIQPDITYLTELGMTEEEVSSMAKTLPATILENLTCFPKIIKVNYATLDSYGIGNIKDVFKGHAHMFLLNPDKFNAIFTKYDQADLVRCIEKNAAVIEKL